MANYIQARLRRPHLDDDGHEEMVLWIPEYGTNGVRVEAGRTVSPPKSDPDQRPWEILSASEPTQPEEYFQRKRGERRDKMTSVQ